MTQSQRKLAETVGVDSKTIRNVKKSLGIDSRTLNDDEERRVVEKVQETVELKRETERKTSKKSDGFVPNVLRRIDKTDESSVLDMLQDCKEQYVRNEELIQRLRYEIDQQDILMHGNGNGTLSAIPQLGLMEKFQKVNISLRNQILALETEVGRFAEPQQVDDPFE